MNDGILTVQMFGGFEVKYGEETISLERSKTTKATQLLQYFLFHRNQKVSRNRLLEILYEKDNIICPVNNLKVTLFRLRKLLISSGLPQDEYISFSEGLYYWKSKIPMKVDTDIFEDFIIESRKPDISDDQKINIYKSAIGLFKGEFLPMISTEDWVVVENIRYKRMYIECVVTLCGLLKARSRDNEIIEISEKAICIYKYDEVLRLIKLNSLLNMKKYKEAASEYNDTANLFFEDLGISPSKDMECFYQRMCSEVENESLSLFNIRENLMETVDTKGAYFCNYIAFIDTFRIITRIVDRFGQSAYLMLCTFEDTMGDRKDNFNKRIKQAAEGLHYAIRGSIRRGDIYTRYNRSQFLVLLIGINQEDSLIVSERINKKFSKEFNVKGIRLDYHVISVTDSDFYSSENTPEKKISSWE